MARFGAFLGFVEARESRSCEISVPVAALGVSNAATDRRGDQPIHSHYSCNMIYGKPAGEGNQVNNSTCYIAGNFQGNRYSLPTSFSASGSPAIRSLWPSQRTFLPVRNAIFAR